MGVGWASKLRRMVEDVAGTAGALVVVVRRGWWAR